MEKYKDFRNNHKKMFFFDIDNTLLMWPEGVVPESTKYAISALQKEGHHVAIATGRIQVDAMMYAKELGISDVVADGGDSITIGNTLIAMESLDIVGCKTFLHQLEKWNIPWAVTIENKRERHTKRDDLAPQVAPWDHFKTVYSPDISIDALDAVYKIYIYLTEEDEKKYEIDYGEFDHVRYGEESILIESMDKAKGIKIMADHFDMPYENIVVFGDGRNDLRMFHPIWLNIAMGNSCEELKSKADYVTDSCKNDGIYKACIHFGWIPKKEEKSE